MAHSACTIVPDIFSYSYFKPNIAMIIYPKLFIFLALASIL